MVDLTFRWFSKGVMLMVKTLGLFFVCELLTDSTMVNHH